MLRLATGKTYHGESVASNTTVSGELVFQTGMTGYLEALTDPSYYGQILVFTYPMVGNYGVHSDHMESDKIQVSGVVVRNLHDAPNSLCDLLFQHNIPCLSGIDTRALVTELREDGTVHATLVAGESDTADPIEIALEKVSRPSVEWAGDAAGNRTIIVVDCGMKRSQLKYLTTDGIRLKIVPWYYNYTEETYHGVFLSNGPGDPVTATATISVLQRHMEQHPDIPVFGICLGHQLLALAAGLKVIKLKYGNRAQNIPVRYRDTNTGYITTQNHGYAVELDDATSQWDALFTNLNDGSNEGLCHKSRPWFSVQFHPEARAGPRDTTWLFDRFLDMIRSPDTVISWEIPTSPEVLLPCEGKKVLVLGSGGLTIGQAGEFDYSGSQALKAYKECGLTTLLINPNIATVQTTLGIGLADKVYSLPVTPEYVMQIIREEAPDYLAVSFGGQTALNCACQLQKIFETYEGKVPIVLGTAISTIELSEDRGAFKDFVAEQAYSCAPSAIVRTLEEGISIAQQLGYPVLVRNGFALGGMGSGFAKDVQELTALLQSNFDSGTPELIVDKSLYGWKELEYEIVRDGYGNTVTVCNMENFDPVGIHTGESIVVAPSQTLNDEQYFMLRECSVKIANGLNIIGECNIQFALHPETNEFYVIELNARLSRSSALASKATGYPLAYVAAKLSLGYSLLDLPNCITQTTSAMYEPSLDYCAVKFPRWDLDKFNKVDRQIGTAMKSVGEVMAIGATFEEALMKAIRMVGINLNLSDIRLASDRIQYIFNALLNGHAADVIRDTQITPWFIERLSLVTNFINEWRGDATLLADSTHLRQAKKLGLSDAQIAVVAETSSSAVLSARRYRGIHPVAKKIDTVAAEFPCTTNYMYLTYHGTTNETTTSTSRKWILVLGSGVYRIGSSVEFDWCSVNCIKTLQEEGYGVVMLNYNPETVSTDYDMTEKLYFDEIELETVLELWRMEQLEGVIVSVGGQQPNNIAHELQKHGVKIIGTSADMIDNAENRYKFSQLLDDISVDQPVWKELTDTDTAVKFSNEVGYPCLVRPSYVLSGAAMNVAFSDAELVRYLGDATRVSKDYPVVISKFIIDAKEIEVDAVARQGEVVLMAISEHIENAGVHSGDATLVHPPQDLTGRTTAQIQTSVHKIATALNINGPFNLQFIAKDDHIKVIECNLRSSRSFPFVSKVTGQNFIRVATKVMLGKDVPVLDRGGQPCEIGVKVPQFSFHRLSGADCVLGVEMMSTGEVACFGKTITEAYLKGLKAVGYKLPEPHSTILLSVGSQRYKAEMLETVRRLSETYKLVATAGTAGYYQEHQVVIEPHTWKDLIQSVRAGEIGFVINVSMLDRDAGEDSNGYQLRRTAIGCGVGLLTDVKHSKLFVEALLAENLSTDLEPENEM